MFCIIVEPLVRWMLQYAVNRCDLIRRLKLSQSMSGSCKLSHNELQMERPATEKARRPNRLGQYRGTTRCQWLTDSQLLAVSDVLTCVLCSVACCVVSSRRRTSSTEWVNDCQSQTFSFWTIAGMLRQRSWIWWIRSGLTSVYLLRCRLCLTLKATKLDYVWLWLVLVVHCSVNDDEVFWALTLLVSHLLFSTKLEYVAVILFVYLSAVYVVDERTTYSTSTVVEDISPEML